MGPRSAGRRKDGTRGFSSGRGGFALCEAAETRRGRMVGTEAERKDQRDG